MSRYRPRHRAGGRLDDGSCEQLTARGMCGRPLDEDGHCHWWRDHVDEIPLDDDEADDLARGVAWFLGGGEPNVGGRPVEDGPDL